MQLHHALRYWAEMKWYHQIAKMIRYQHFMQNSVLMNWSPINKSLLVLVLGALGHCLWVFWYFTSFYVESFRQWLNPDLYRVHMTALGFFLIGYLFLLYLCLNYSHHARLKLLLPYVSVLYFGTSFIHGGYHIGIMSPATIASFVSLVSVGLVLFERKIVYATIVPISLFIISAVYLTLEGQIRYAPLFSPVLFEQDVFQNTYWVYSMVYLYIPIFFISIILFEVLLIQWRNREKMIDQLSRIDPLTGIFNRRSITHGLNQAKEQKKVYALILLDLDHFKKINDNYGHEAGDRVLQQVAKILSFNLRSQDIVGRFGGEEFILVLLEADIPRAMDIAERCRQQIEQTEILVMGKQHIRVTASFGVAVSNGYQNKEEVIRLADAALYQAKAEGRNCIRVASSAQILSSHA